jgi:Tat protein secretion system quality control protein TatD with DNase activity
MSNLRVVSTEVTKDPSTLERIIQNRIVTILHSQDFDNLLSCLSYAKKYPGIFYCSIGKHPSNLGTDIENNFKNGTLSLVHAINRNIIQKNCENVISIGECGLNYHTDYCNSKDIQKEIFKMYIELAIEFAKPIFIFDNCAFNDIIEIIDDYNSDKRANMGLWRCHKIINSPYATTEQLKEYTRRGFKILVTSAIYRNAVSEGFIEGMKEIPLDKIVIGSSNSTNQRMTFNNNPSDINIIFKKLHEIRQEGLHKETEEQILCQVMESSLIVLGIPFTEGYRMIIKRNFINYINSVRQSKYQEKLEREKARKEERNICQVPIKRDKEKRSKPYSPPKGKNKKAFEKDKVEN